MFVGNSNRIGRAQRTRHDVNWVAGDFTDEVSYQFNVEVRGVRRTSGLVGKAEAEQIKRIDTKVARERVEILAPHETGRTGAHAMDEDERWTSVTNTGSLVEDASIF